MRWIQFGDSQLVQGLYTIHSSPQPSTRHLQHCVVTYGCALGCSTGNLVNCSTA